jgi:PAS domain S-box-containing protein
MPLNFAMNDPIDLTNCDREPIHIPNKIQPFGFLLVVDLQTFKILQFSKNISQFLNETEDNLIGKEIRSLLPQEEFEQIETAIKEGQLNYLNPIDLHYKSTNRPYRAVLHISEKNLILENEEAIDNFKYTDYYSAANRLMEDMKKSKNLGELSNILIEHIRQITRYDRVMVYEFDEDWNGEVIAENRKKELYSFLGQHFPASDIPVQARQLYLRNPLRIIPDVDYIPVEIVPSLNPISQGYIDLSRSFLRSVSPIHIEYLQNMGVRATLVISIIINDRLWGLIACHHYQPKFLDCRLRSLLEHFGNIFAYNIDLLHRIKLKDFDIKIHSVETEIIKKLNHEEDFFSGLAKQLPLLLQLNSASGVVLFYGDNLFKEGVTPDREFIVKLVDWLFMNHRQTIFQTNCLSELFKDAEGFVAIASGILTMRLTKYEKNYIIWFKPETIQSVVWGGNPKEKILSIPTDDGYRLSPRKSFEKWEEVVRRKSLKWEESEINLVESLRIYFQEFLANQISFLEAKNLELNIRIQEKVLETKRANQQLQLTNEQILYQNETLRVQHENIMQLFQELKNHKNQLKAIFDNTKHVIYLLNLEGRILFFNQLAYQRILFFYKKELEIGEKITEYAKDKDELERMEIRIEKARSGESFVIEEEYIHGEHNSSFWFRIEYDPVYEESSKNLIGIAVLITDITAIKRASNRIENQNKMLKEIAFLQSHRVRRPLANILGLINLFNQNDMNDPFNKTILDKMLFSTHELDEIIHSIVDKTYDME